MRTFILRARTAPTSDTFIDKFIINGDNHFEVVCHVIVNSLLVSKQTREDVILHIVCEGSPEPTKIITIDSGEVGNLGGFDEKTITGFIKQILSKTGKMDKNEIRNIRNGVSVSKRSFESLIRDLSGKQTVYMLSRKGTDIRNIDLQSDSCFIFTDHIPMQKNTIKLLKRIGVKMISLGPKVLFASQCIVLVNNEIDRNCF